MKHNWLKNLFLVILLVLAVVLGKLLGTVTAKLPFLAWLGMSADFGLKPVTVDLAVVNFTFGLMININVAQALLLAVAILAFSAIRLRA